MESNIIDERKIPPPEVTLRAIQKDNEFRDYLSLKIAEFYESLTNFIPISMVSDKIDTFSSFVFYYLSYIRSPFKTTPGEEYVKVKKQQNQGMLFYILLISLRTYFTTFIQDKFIEYIRKRHPYQAVSLYDRIIIRLSKSFPSVEGITESLEDLQLCYFFINNKFFDFSQRLFNVYNSTRETTNILIDENGFKLLGYMILSRYFIQGYKGMKKFYQIYKEENGSIINNYVDNGNLKLKVNQTQTRRNEKYKTCLLCMEERKNISVTICGHLFCWGCITKFLQTKENCPFCRTICLPQQVVYLQNFN
jgi:hypothetical protein